ncbi:MAG: hypothetical protein V1726_00285 [Methanobacteriota archaeon]
MTKCKACGQQVLMRERMSFPIEHIKKVCEPCFDHLMKEKGYTITLTPQNYKIYTLDNGVKYRQYIPRGPAHQLLPRKEQHTLQEGIVLDMLNRKLETAAKRIEQRYN